MKITVTGDLGSFKGGQVLQDDAKIALYYRTIVNEGADKPTKMSDEGILACVYAYQGDDEDTEIQRVEQIESGKVPTDDEGEILSQAQLGTSLETIGAVRAEMKRASEIAEKFTSDLDADLVSFISAKKIVNTMALQFKLKLEGVFGIDDMRGWPVPGSTKKSRDELHGVGSNVPFDKYSRYVAGSGKKTVASSFYGDIIDRTQFGQNNAVKTKQLQDSASKDPAIKANTPAEYRGLTTSARTVLMDQLDNDRKTAIALIGRAVELFQKEQEVSEMLPLINVRYSVDKDGNIQGRKVMVLTDKNTGDIEPMTISMFKSINVQAALLLGGTLENVLNTLGAVEDEEGDTEDKEGVATMTLDTFAATTADVLNFLETVEEDAGKLGLFYARLNKEGPDTDHEIATYFKLKEQLEMICNKPTFAKRFADFEMREKNAEKIGAVA